MKSHIRSVALILPALIASNCGGVSYSSDAAADLGPSDSSVDRGGGDGGDGRLDDIPDAAADSSHPSGTVLDPDGIMVEKNACPNCRRPVLGCSNASRLLIWGDKGQKHLMLSRLEANGNIAGEADPLGPFEWLGSGMEMVYGPQQYLMVFSASWVIRGLPFTSDGSVAEHFLIASRSPVDAYDPAVAFHETTGDYLVAWTESHTYSNYVQIMAARVTTKGEVRDQAGFLITEGDGVAHSPAIACRETGCLVVFVREKNIYGTMVKGDQVAQVGGTPIVDSPADESSPVVISGADGFFLVWVTEQKILGASLDDSGVIQYEVSIADRPEGVLPSVASSGDSFLVAWADKSIHAVRTDGAKILDDPPLVISAMPEENSDVSLCFDGTNYLAAWLNREETDGLHNIFAARIVP